MVVWYRTEYSPAGPRVINTREQEAEGEKSQMFISVLTLWTSAFKAADGSNTRFVTIPKEAHQASHRGLVLIFGLDGCAHIDGLHRSTAVSRDSWEPLAGSASNTLLALDSRTMPKAGVMDPAVLTDGECVSLRCSSLFPDTS